MEQKRDMKKHVTFVAALHIGFGILKLIGGVALFFLFSIALNYINDGDTTATTAVNAIRIVFSTVMIGSAVLGIIGGIALLSYKGWARILVIVLSALNCLNIPIGTAKGVYSIWTLLQDETIELFEARKQG
jgi:hypothetical protein